MHVRLNAVLSCAFVVLTVAACSSTTTKVADSAPPSTPVSSAPTVSASSASPSPMSSAPAPIVFPLTGLPAATKAAAQQPSLAVKIDNVAGAWPQAGVNQADIVVDTPVEGGLTRLFAVFQSQQVPLVGPIRSARPVDGDLLRLLGGGYFAYSGANAGEIGPVKANSTAVMMSFDADNSLFMKRSDHASPHNIFNSTARLYAYGEQIKAGLAPPHPMFTYGGPAPSGAPVTTAAIRFPSASAAWHWDGRQYLRDQDGHADVLMGGDRVSADNVVIMSVGLRDSGVRDSLGHVEPWPSIIGSGSCWVLRNGVMVQGTWKRAGLTTPMTLTDAAGHVIALTPGRTWVELATTAPQLS